MSTILGGMLKIFISLVSQEEGELDVEELELINIKIRKLLKKDKK